MGNLQWLCGEMHGLVHSPANQLRAATVRIEGATAGQSQVTKTASVPDGYISA